MSQIIRRLTILLALVLLSWPQTAAAQSGPVGIGFAQAEEGTWWCRGDNAVDTLDCARAKCRAEAGGQDCYRTAWCYPAGWSGLMAVWLSDFHSTDVMCGAPTREALRAAMEAFCHGHEYASSCELFLLIDPEGNEIEVTLTFSNQQAALDQPSDSTVSNSLG